MKSRQRLEFQCKCGNWHETKELALSCDLSQKIADLVNAKRVKLLSRDRLGKSMECQILAYAIVHNTLTIETLIQEHLDVLSEPT